jgi:hypothetical protein
VTKVVGEKVLAEDEKTKDVLLRQVEGTAEMAAAARLMAARTAVVERIKLKILQPLAFLFGIRSDYFADTFPQEMAAKLTEVPEENIVTPFPPTTFGKPFPTRSRYGIPRRNVIGPSAPSGVTSARSPT